MQQNFDLDYLIGDEAVTAAMPKQPAFPIFSEEACQFLQAVSQRLLKDPAAKAYSDVMTFAFWCRKSSLQQMAKSYDSSEVRLGRGIVFHIAPSNVAVNFAYSFVSALLAGNASIVRVPSKKFAQVDLICGAMRDVLQADFPAMQAYICMVRYGHDTVINAYFSQLCDTRVIWGGDRTIKEIRQAPLKSRANEITFADRFSMAVIQSEDYLAAEDKNRIAQDFYNDTYLTDQNACTSPRIVIWLGKPVAAAQQDFWDRLHLLLKKSYRLPAVRAIDKLVGAYLLGANCLAHQVFMPDTLVVRIQVDNLQEDLMKYQGNSGFFMEYLANDIVDILPLCTESCQTVSYYGDIGEGIRDLVLSERPRGIDRIVPLGHTLDFSLVWDGRDLVREMSRRI
jgi:hypothetical protein